MPAALSAGAVEVAAVLMPPDLLAAGGFHAATRPATSSMDDPVNVSEMVPISGSSCASVAVAPADGWSIGGTTSFVQPVYILDIGDGSARIMT
jgi:hypothetical protein